MCPAPMKEIGQKGAAKPCRVPPAECHTQSGLKCTGRRPSPPGLATKGCMVRQRSMCRKPLYLAHQPLDSVMAWRVCGRIRVYMMFLPDGHEYPYPEAGHSFYPASRKATRGRACHLSTHTVEDQEHGNRILSACHGDRLSVEDRGRTDAGRSLRSSLRTGKPAIWRREAGDRLAFEAGGYLWTQMERPTRSGSSTCRRSSISGVTLWSLESRMHSERCMSGSERGYGKPMAERSHGACNLLLPYIRLCDEFIYLAVILDAFSRKCIGWELKRTPRCFLNPWCAEAGSSLSVH